MQWIFSQLTCVLLCTLDRVAFYIQLTLTNRYPGAIRLKIDLPSPNDYFKIKTGSTLTKTIGVTSIRTVSLSAFSVLTNKKLLINGLPVFEITPSQPLVNLDYPDTKGLWEIILWEYFCEKNICINGNLRQLNSPLMELGMQNVSVLKLATSQAGQFSPS
jgi:hypothetical protein